MPHLNSYKKQIDSENPVTLWGLLCTNIEQSHAEYALFLCVFIEIRWAGWAGERYVWQRQLSISAHAVLVMAPYRKLGVRRLMQSAGCYNCRTKD